MDHAENSLITVQITDLGDRGEGIGKADGFTWFVKGALPGDVVSAKVTKVKKAYGLAEAVNIVSPSPYRVTPPCPYFSDCGGCQLQAMDYQAQLKFKEDLIKNQFKRIGGIEDPERVVLPVMGMEDPWRYRNNEQFFPGTDQDGHIVFGFYAGRTHRIVSQDDCLVGIKENAPILRCIQDHMEKYGILPYDEQTGMGLLGRVQIRKGFATGDIMVCLDIHGPMSDLKEPQKLSESLRSLFPEAGAGPHIRSICCHCPRSSDNNAGSDFSADKDPEMVTLYGPGYITDKIGSLEFQISPLSFYQVNPAQTEHLYDTVMNFADLSGNETVWDLYCGTGTISLFLARRAKWVCGVEIVPQAVEDARLNAQRNGIENVSFFTGKAEKVLPEQVKKSGIHSDVIVADPPRKGCERECLKAMIKMQPSRIVYVSCDSATLARDIKILREGGYEPDTAQPIDLFPQSVHIETVTLLHSAQSSVKGL